jgi:hypothetical protein
VIEHEEASELAVRMSIEAGAAGAGFLLGGPVGAILAPAVVPLMELVALRRRRAAANVELFSKILSDTTKRTPKEIAEWGRSPEGRMFLLTSAMQAAYLAQADAHVRGLARVVAVGVNNDDQIDYSRLKIGALAQLDEPHLRVLTAMVRDIDKRPPYPTDQAPGSWLTSQLAEYMPGFAVGLEPICAALVRTGMLREAMPGFPSSPAARADSAWLVTHFGEDCVKHFDEFYMS